MNDLNGKSVSGQKSLRSACDLCHQGKVKCGGGIPCEGCHKLGLKCTYSISNRTGRPKGVKNKRTLERIKQLRAANGSEQQERAPDSKQATSAQISRQSSLTQASSNEASDQISPPTPPSLSGHTSSSRDANLNSWAEGSSAQFWNLFSISDSSHANSESSEFSEPRSGNARSPSSSLAFPSSEMTDNLSQDLSWIRSLLNTPDLTIPPLDRHGNTPKLPLAADQYSPKTPIPTSGQFKSTAPHTPQLNSCNCFQQLTEQLSNFKALSHSLGQLRSDFILTLARDALARWQTHLSCPSCQHNEDKDILILSVMALRALLNLVKEVGQHELQSPRDATGDEGIGVPSELFDADHSCLGTYRLACEERRIVVDLLLHRTLRSLNQTTEHLRQKSLRMAGSYARRNTTSSLSSRSESSVSLPGMSSSVSCILPDDLSMDGGVHDVGLTRDKVSLDEHDNYLQESLQGSTATIEFLLVKLQSHDMNQRTDNSEIFGF